MARTLCIGDPHCPVSHPAYLPFIKSIQKKYKTDQTIFMGDVADIQAISFHSINPNCPGALDEYQLAKREIQRWYKAFPEAKVCIGNHDERVIRLAESMNIPSKYLRNFAEVWNTPGWEWDYDFVIDNVYYTHGTGQGGKYPATNMMRKMLMSVVLGHNHSRAGIYWRVNPYQRIFSMDTGCGIDQKAFQFAYGKHMKEKPVLGCGVVVDGKPYHEIMPCNEGEEFQKQRFNDDAPVAIEGDEITKICSKCNKEKSLLEFYERPDSKDGYRAQCKECCK